MRRGGEKKNKAKIHLEVGITPKVKPQVSKTLKGGGGRRRGQVGKLGETF